MNNSIIPLSDLQFVEGSSLDPAAMNAVPVAPTGPNILAAEPSSLALAFTGIGILGVYAVLKRWRRPQQPSLLSSSTPATDEKIAAEQPKRGAA